MIKLTFLHLGRHLMHKQISIVFLRSCSHVHSMFATSFVYWFQRWFSYLWFCWRKYENNYVYPVATLNFFPLFINWGTSSFWFCLMSTFHDSFRDFHEFLSILIRYAPNITCAAWKEPIIRLMGSKASLAVTTTFPYFLRMFLRFQVTHIVNFWKS